MEGGGATFWRRRLRNCQARHFPNPSSPTPGGPRRHSMTKQQTIFLCEALITGGSTEVVERHHCQGAAND
jgi:hypothetical protein